MNKYIEVQNIEDTIDILDVQKLSGFQYIDNHNTWLISTDFTGSKSIISNEEYNRVIDVCQKYFLIRFIDGIVGHTDPSPSGLASMFTLNLNSIGYIKRYRQRTDKDIYIYKVDCSAMTRTYGSYPFICELDYSRVIAKLKPATRE